MAEVRDYNAAVILFSGDGVPAPAVVAALAWEGEEGREWDLVAMSPAVEPILRGHFGWPGARSADAIRKFVQDGLKGYRMEAPTRARGVDARAAARETLKGRVASSGGGHRGQWH